MNLLPDTEKKLLKKGLVSRFIIVSTFAIAGAIIVGFVALVPAYVLARVKLLEVMSKSNITIETDKADSPSPLLGLPEEIKSKLSVFESLIPQHRVVEIFYEITKVKPEGVSIKSISFLNNTNPTNANRKTMNIAGTAVSRKSLVDFSESLKKVSLIKEVEVPVSNLARERDLPFAIKIIIAQ